MDNETTLSGFLLLEFSKVRELQMLHFFVFLILYLAIVASNLLIISAIAHDRHLHTPMYFFLMNLAIQDLGAATVTIPKSMANSLMNTRQISYSGCVAQVLFLIFFIVSDYFLLTVMAYDRYVAICNPLRYEMVMNQKACMQMISGVWISGLLYGILQAGGTFAPHFCSNVVNQFFCEIPHLLTLACDELYLIETGFVALGAIISLGCFIFIIITYVRIFTAVLRIPSVQGRKKAFSTCVPHLIVCSTFVVAIIVAHLRPPSKVPSHLDVAITILYSMVPSMLNPVVYSMRNKDIKFSLSKLFGFQ